jgi:hypothetical protein
VMVAETTRSNPDQVGHCLPSSSSSAVTVTARDAHWQLVC